MQIRSFSVDQDYQDLVNWWEVWKFSPMPAVFLSSNGFVAEKDGKKLGTVFVYMSDSAVCWMEWLTTNPECTREERKEAMDLLIQAVVKYAQDNKYLAIFTATVHPTLKKLYPKHNFQPADTNVSHFLWIEGAQ